MLCLHMAALIQELLQYFHWENLDHLSYSLDSAPSNLFSALKEHLSGHRFQSGEDVETAVTGWLYAQDTTFCRKGIKTLLLWLDKCLSYCHSDYIEKWGIHHGTLCPNNFYCWSKLTFGMILKLKCLCIMGVTGRSRVNEDSLLSLSYVLRSSTFMNGSSSDWLLSPKWAFTKQRLFQICNKGVNIFCRKFIWSESCANISEIIFE